MPHSFSIRPARPADLPALEALVPLSVRSLQAAHYSPAQMEAALGPVFGVDRQLIADGTYFVAEQAGAVIGCGGWSRRRSEFGSDGVRTGVDAALDPARDPARIRAFFVHPAWARRGIGRTLLATCEAALCAAGFREAILVATLTGVPLYTAGGYRLVEYFSITLAPGITLPGARMAKSFLPAAPGT
jgi:N-acetylglutamate synthase-like GNAT family acetyltransferase